MSMVGNNWVEKDGKLYNRYEFSDFATALQFANVIGRLAESANHHPDISIGWGYVEVNLFTHSENAITEKDKELSRNISKAYNSK